MNEEDLLEPKVFTEELGSPGNDTLTGSDSEAVFGLPGDDLLTSSPGLLSGSIGSDNVLLFGGSGSDTYQIQPNSGSSTTNDSLRKNSLNIEIYENGNSDNDTLVIDASFNSQNVLIYEIDNRHLGIYYRFSEYYVQIDIYNWQEPVNRLETFEFQDVTLSYEDFVNSFRNNSNYTRNLTVEEAIEVGDNNFSVEEYNAQIETNFSIAKEREEALLTIEDFLEDSDEYISLIRDFDGNDLGESDSWENIGSVDIQGDGDIEYIFVNPELGRWATVGDINGFVDFSQYGEDGDTRIVGIYEDPLVASGDIETGSSVDSQQRFQNDLFGNRLTLLDGDDYDGDGLQEIYFGVENDAAVLHAYMFPDGNIQYANYQSESDLAQFMNENGIDSSVWSDWL